MAGKIATLLGALLQTAATPHRIDRYLELVDERITWEELRAEIVAIKRWRNPSSVTLELQPTRQWVGHKAGQFIQLSVVIDGVRHTRCFSPTNAESENDRIQLHIGVTETGLVSRHLFHNAVVGEMVRLTPATGIFSMPTPRPDAAIFISGGSGITPVLAMLRTLVHENYDKEIIFIHYAKHPETMPFFQELTEISTQYPLLKLALIRTENLAGDVESGGELTGHFSAQHFEKLCGELSKTAQTFVCGPESLLAAVRAEYELRQIAGRLHSETFGVSSNPHSGTTAEGSLVFSNSQMAVDNSGETILVQAEKAGLAPESGCRMGICFSCTAIKKSGCTQNILNGELDREVDKHIQLCISAPIGDVEIDI